jgi:hypothetical protein
MALTDTIADRYRGTRYAESALYLWQRWSGRIDERTALLDSLLANPDTSRAGWLEPEAEVELTPPPADSTTAEMRRGYVMSHEDSARVDSLMKLGQERREKLREGGGIR